MHRGSGALASACKGHVVTHSFAVRKVYWQQYSETVKQLVSVKIEETENCL